MLARNLMGETSQTSVTVNVDRTGPVISIDSPISEAGVLKGYAFDYSGLAELAVNGQKFFPAGAQQFQLPEIHPGPEQEDLLVRASDLAGNITHARIPLSNATDMLEAKNLLAQNAVFSEIIPSKIRVCSDSLAKNFSFAKNISEELGNAFPRKGVQKWSGAEARSVTEFLRPRMVGKIRFFQAPKYLAAPKDHSPPHIELNDLKNRITYFDHLYVQGNIWDEKSKVKELRVNGKQILKVTGSKIYFNHLIPP